VSTRTVGRLAPALVSAGLLAGSTFAASLAHAAAPITLTFMTHYDASQAQLLQPYINRYEKLHPNIKIVLDDVAYADEYTKITLSALSPNPPALYDMYNLWLAPFAHDGVLAPAPAAYANNIRANYAPGTVGAVTYQGKIYGYPTESDDYLLDYNKVLFAKAGIKGPPRTWAQVLADAKKLTQKNKAGQVQVEGFGLITGWNSGVVHPFTAMLWSDGGQLFNPAGTKVAFDSAQGLQTLTFYQTLVKDGYTVPSMGNAAGTNSNEYIDNFEAGKIAMMVMADWWESTLASGMKNFNQTVGVAPIPIGPDGKKSITVQYSWMDAVNAHSPYKAQAWAFLEWLDSPAANGATPEGSWLVSQGIMPSRTSDQRHFKAQLGTPFMKPYVEAFSNSKPWPLVFNGNEISNDLMNAIESVEFKQASPSEALATAKSQVQPLLAP
jgi:multiple sugar transport system substrate-binding protein